MRRREWSGGITEENVGAFAFEGDALNHGGGKTDNSANARVVDGERLDSLDPDSFKYVITAKEIVA